MAIIITCIGGSDPIRSFRDGPLLHILRHNPDITECYAFLSKEIQEIHSNPQKNYFNKVYGEFSKVENREIKFNTISLNIDKTNDFDIYFDIFLSKFKDILSKYQLQNEKIYVNLTSGTPQMQMSIALVTQQYSYLNIVPIQVDNFSVDSKDKSPMSMSSEYSIEEEMFFLFNENYIIENENNRCHIVKLYNIMKNNFIEQVKSLLNKYDYSSINDLYKNMLDDNVKSLVLFSKYRQEMNYEKAANTLKTRNYPVKKYLPLYNPNEDGRKNSLFEYFLSIVNLLENDQYNDAIIRIDQYTIELQQEFLNKIFSFITSNYLNKYNSYFEIRNLENHDPLLAQQIKDGYSKKNRKYVDGYVSIYLLNVLIEIFTENTNDQYKEEKDFFNKIQKLHEYRNGAAHKLSIITLDDIKPIISKTKIIEMFKKILKELYPEINDQFFYSYENVNKEILELIK